MTGPDGACQAVLDELEKSGGPHDALQSEHRHKRLNLEPATARLLRLLVLNGQHRRVLEIGTSNGYSALCLADALRSIPQAQPLITVEREAGKAAQARQNIARAGLEQWVDVRVGDATQVVADLAGPFDAVFFDADRVSAPQQLEILLPKLSANCLLLADNATSHPEELSGYVQMVERMPSFTSVIIPVGKGLHVACRSGR